ncbi:MAG: hypothetical protein R3B84_19210 [Zavarzinella sp.]
MKKLFLLVACAIALSVGASESAAQQPGGCPGGCATPGMPAMPSLGHPGMGMGHPGMGGGMFHSNGRFGWNPIFSRLFSSHDDNYGKGMFRRADVIPLNYQPYYGGTLVFPVNPYIRSPRDFFMAD